MIINRSCPKSNAVFTQCTRANATPQTQTKTKTLKAKQQIGHSQWLNDLIRSSLDDRNLGLRKPFLKVNLVSENSPASVCVRFVHCTVLLLL